MSHPKAFIDNVSEAEFQAAIIALAQAKGWLVHAERPAPSKKGWRTPIQGDKGFPDLVLARDGTVLHWEIKSLKGILNLEQKAWLKALGGKSMSVMVVRPSDWEWAQKMLE